MYPYIAISSSIVNSGYAFSDIFFINLLLHKTKMVDEGQAFDANHFCQWTPFQALAIFFQSSFPITNVYRNLPCQQRDSSAKNSGNFFLTSFCRRQKDQSRIGNRVWICYVPKLSYSDDKICTFVISKLLTSVIQVKSTW